MKRKFKTNSWEMPSNTEEKNSIDRRHKNRCPNCDHIHSIGKFGVGTNIEVKCSKCKVMFYVRQL